MARKRIELTQEQEGTILAYASRGAPARAIFDALGGKVSASTIARRVDELKLKGLNPATDPETGDIPQDPEAFSEAAQVLPLEMIDKWITRINKAAEGAEAGGDISEIGTLGRLMATLLEVKRKATPIPKIDPNQSPDMITAKKRAFDLLLKAVEKEVSAYEPKTFRGGTVRTLEDITTDLVCAALDSLETVEAAALAYDWGTWGREKQQAPPGKWRLWGFLTGRGFGKTISISSYINQEVEEGRVTLICLIAQDEQSSVDIQINGPSGLIATAPPWNRPKFSTTDMTLTWPNGARAIVRTPEVPGKIRGLEYEITWASELQSWPASQREEAWSNVLLSTRIGRAQVIWDSTPKKRHPILKDLIKDAQDHPSTQHIVRGTTHENAGNLADGYVEELERKYGRTSKGREELLGEMLEESENAMVRQVWIDENRRKLGDLARRVISVDPAVTDRKGSDQTGMIEAGLGHDGQAYVIGDYSGKHKPGAWAKLVLDRYVEGKCDLVIVETNKGGDLVTQNLRAAAAERGLTVTVFTKAEKTRHIRHVKGSVFVKEVHSRGEKQDRAQPMATAYELGRVSHVIGSNLTSLEDTLTTWEPTPGARSPDDLDAATAAIVELLSLQENATDPDIAFKGINKAHAEIIAPKAAPAINGSSFMSLFRGSGVGSRI